MESACRETISIELMTSDRKLKIAQRGLEMKDPKDLEDLTTSQTGAAGTVELLEQDPECTLVPRRARI